MMLSDDYIRGHSLTSDTRRTDNLGWIDVGDEGCLAEFTATHTAI